MQPDHRAETLKELISTLLQGKQERAEFWSTDDGIGFGWGKRDVHAGLVLEPHDEKTLKVTLHVAHQEAFDSIQRLCEKFGIESTPPEKYPASIELLVPYDEAYRIVEHLLHVVLDKHEDDPLIWYGTEQTPITPLRIYPMGCITVWAGILVVVGLILSMFF